MNKYFVIFHKREWVVKHGPTGFETYPSRKAAIDAAVAEARRSGDSGTAVVAQDDHDAVFRTEWTSAPQSDREPLIQPLF
jgi:hypothetical protein